ncbi:MAG: glycosyltransferase [Saprospiraceae bacterium]|nr:glycosyltransferase [Saprospiraceae bacterium]
MVLTGLAALGLIAVLLYTHRIFGYIRDWRAIPPAAATGDASFSVSVVIAARNEARYLGQCLASMTQQHYPADLLEVIVVDDHSTDRTAEIAAQFPSVRVIQLAGIPGAGRGKKAALSTGIGMANGEIIAMTDADCLVGPGWVRTMAASFTDEVQAATGPVVYQAATGLLSSFQALEILGLMVVTGAGVFSGRHRLGNGASLAIRRAVFEEVGGYGDHAHLASGDDLFMLEAIARRHPGSLRYVKSQDALVQTGPQRTWYDLISQRLRWASKNAALEDRSIILTWIAVWLLHVVLMVALLLVSLMSWSGWSLVVVAVIIKAYADHRLLSTAATFAGQKRAMRWFVPAFALNFFYVLYIGVLSAVSRRYSWKGRPY